ncbi:MAG: DNA recombination protein RmuC [Gemmatimonadaceae bacterium]|jgi:DNA recombination protein RmuC|nr:DNA recombination protein RmuC [Gemmatimonadaceae bacterium]
MPDGLTLFAGIIAIVATVAAVAMWFMLRTLEARSEARTAQAMATLAAAHGDALQRSTDLLLGRAREVLGAERDQLAATVVPVREALGSLDRLVHDLEARRTEADGRLREQLAQLGSAHRLLGDETRRLATALRDPQARGTWGELQLRRVVELAGMQAHCDFEEQVTVRDARHTDAHDTPARDALQRPDLVVRLPGDKCIVVDAKAPLRAYLQAIEAGDDGARDRALREHAQQVRMHVRILAGKAYWNALANAPDFVVCFLPGEAFLQAALAHDLSLLDDALAAHVLLASPVTLIALLKSAAYGWQQERLARNAEAIREAATELATRVGVLAGHFAEIGTSLERAGGAYNRALRSYDRRVLPQARTLADLGVPSDARLEAPAPVLAAPTD